MTRLLIVNTDRFSPRGMAGALARRSGIEVVGVATSVAEALGRIKGCDTLLVSAALPNHGALELVQKVSDSEPWIKVLVMDMERAPDPGMSYLNAGAAGWVM